MELTQIIAKAKDRVLETWPDGSPRKVLPAKRLTKHSALWICVCGEVFSYGRNAGSWGLFASHVRDCPKAQPYIKDSLIMS